ncbi:MAG: hypothetical protein II781_03575 [Clostridia bacterium]|nr:hypothetical protein [Clostridia bacterium]
MKKINPAYLMTAEEGRQWNAFKATLGPIYPGYESFDTYMHWLRERFAEYGCVDFREHHWTHETYRVRDWPDHESGALRLWVEGKEIPVGTFLMLSPSTGEKGFTLPLTYYDVREGDPKPGAFAGKIVVMREQPMPRPPFTDEFLASYVVTDTDYRSDPEPPAPMFTIVDPRKNNSWNTRWSFAQWGGMVQKAMLGGAAAMVVVSNLTYGTLRGLYDRQRRHTVPSLVVDRTQGEALVDAARAGKLAGLTLVSEFFPADAWNFVCFLPGRDYGTDRDEYVTVNNHVDAMSLTQDNGSLGSLGIARYFSHIPQAERRKTILFCLDSRHFIEGFENGNIEHDPYRVFPDLVKKVTVTIGLEHMGEMEAAEDYAHNTMVPTGRPELSFMKADDNDFCADLLIQSVIDSGLERADIKIDGRPGLHGQFKGRVRAIQAACHRLGVCEIGLAGNWPGAHTQTFSGMEYFGEKKFRDEVHVWTQVTAGFLETDSIVYNIVWAKLNTAIRQSEALSVPAREGLLQETASVFRSVVNGEYAAAAQRLCTKLVPAARELNAETVAEAAEKAAEALRTCCGE